MTAMVPIPDLTPAQHNAVLHALAMLDAGDTEELTAYGLRPDVVARTLRIFQEADDPPVEGDHDQKAWLAVQVAVEELRSAFDQPVTGFVLVVNGDEASLMPVHDRPDLVPPAVDAPRISVEVAPVIRPPEFVPDRASHGEHLVASVNARVLVQTSRPSTPGVPILWQFLVPADPS